MDDKGPKDIGSPVQHDEWLKRLVPRFNSETEAAEWYQNQPIAGYGGRTAADLVSLMTDPRDAAEGADMVTTDVWASMGQEAEQQARAQKFANYQVNKKLMQLANKDAIFMHCLPAHRGEEVSADVIDGDQSVVWEQAGNRLHSQKALLEYLLVR